MVKQYPYILQVFIQTEPTQDPVTGAMIPGTSSWEDVCKCRDEAGNGKRLKLQDNEFIEFSFLIQMPIGSPALEKDTKVRVMQDSIVRCEGSIIYSRKDQLHSRIWV